MRPATLAVALCALAATSTATLAGTHRYPLDPVYREECGSCHVAYPAALLDAAAWRRTLEGLAKHFGNDASVDATTKARLAAWLEASAGRRAPAAQGEPRVTTTPWFRREHREVGPASVAAPAVGSFANCSACHPGALAGDYAEHDLRLPRPPGGSR